MKGLVRDLEEKDNIKTDLRTTGKVRRLMPEEELILFRVVQEALNNVKRHAGASRVEVEAGFHSSGVRISVKDNGSGFNAPEKIGDLVSSGRLGLIGMYERARMLDGTLIIRSKPGQGTVVIVDAPMQPHSRIEERRGGQTQ
jgi:signal transduction histidine kinase